jgi:hypothetical protein
MTNHSLYDDSPSFHWRVARRRLGFVRMISFHLHCCACILGGDANVGVTISGTEKVLNAMPNANGPAGGAPTLSHTKRKKTLCQLLSFKVRSFKVKKGRKIVLATLEIATSKFEVAPFVAHYLYSINRSLAFLSHPCATCNAS